MGSLEGAVVIVTGAARGIGRAIAEELGQGGAKVVVNYAHSKGPAEDLVAQLHKSGSPESVAIQADVSDPEQAASLLDETIQRFGRIDVLVNNASRFYRTSIGKITEYAWEDLMNSNLKAPFFLSQAAAPHLALN